MIFAIIMMGIIVAYYANIFLFLFSATRRQFANVMIYLIILLFPFPIYWSQCVDQSSLMTGEAYLFHLAPNCAQATKKTRTDILLVTIIRLRVKI